jgi:dihydropteroate synthase
MEIINRTPDSFCRPGLTWDEARELDGCTRSSPKVPTLSISAGFPLRPPWRWILARRSGGLPISSLRSQLLYPEVVIRADTWRNEAGWEACAAGADLITDSWGGWNEPLAEMAAEFGVGLVCAHAGGQQPKIKDFRVAYAEVMADALKQTLRLVGRAVDVGVGPARIVIDAARDFDKSTWHSLEITRRLAEVTTNCWPVLGSAYNEDFIGETLGVSPEERLAAMAACPWQGARIFLAHHGRETRHVVDMVSAIRGDIPSARALRGLA